MTTSPELLPVAQAERVTEASLALAIERDSVRAMYAQSPQGLVVGVVLGAILVYVFTKRVGVVALFWYAALLASQLAGWVALRHFQRQDALGQWQPSRMRLGYSLRTWLAGALLGCTSWLFFSPDYGDARWLTVLIICGISAGSVTSYAYHLPTLWGFLLLLNMPLWVRLLQIDIAPGYWVGHVVHVFYIGMLFWFGSTQHATLLGAIRMRHENALLLNELQQRTDALEQANLAKARFFAAASHDLRQPLQALGYYSGLLQPHEEDRPHVQRIQQCVDSLDGLLEGVLSISQLDAGKVQKQLQPVDLAALLQRMLILYEGVAQQCGLQLRLRTAARLRCGQPGLWVRTDPVLLERVLSNLLANALRYTPQGGVLITVRARQEQVCLQVWDTGVGIAPEHLSQVFDEFVQLGNPQRDLAQGVGLGLATVQRICRLLEHPLTLRSIPQHGSVFSVELPASEPAQVLEAPTLAQHEPVFKGRILLVEDNDLVRESLAYTLAGWGLHVKAVPDVTEAWTALEAAGAAGFDAVLSDWRLPGEKNGLQLLEQIAPGQPYSCGLRVLMTGEAEHSLGTLPEGIVLLKKPVRPIRLRSLLSAYWADHSV